MAKGDRKPTRKRYRLHGLSGHPLYKVWVQMWQRCVNPNVPNYHIYGGKGIRVCNRWKEFEHFLEDMGERPRGATIDRIDGNLGYTPSNCRWASRIEQNNNTAKNRWVTFKGRRQTVSQWARELNLHKTTILRRLNSGWTDKEALCGR